MLTRPTKQDFRNIFMMIEASNKLNRLTTLEESLGHGSMSFLLTEDVSEDEAEKLDSAVKQTRAGLEALAGSMPGTKMENVKKYFQELVAELPDNGEMVKLAIKGDTKTMKKRAQTASAAMTQIQKARDSFANSVALLGGQLSKTTFAKEQKPEIIQKSLKDLAAMGEDERGDFPDEKTLRTGIERSYVPSKESKGLFGKIVGWFKGKMGKELDKSVFTEDMLGLSLEELAGMVAEVKKADAKGDKGAEAAGEAMAGMEDDLSGAAEEEGGKVASPGEAQKRPNFDLMQYIEDNYPDFLKKLTGAGVKDGSDAVEAVDAAVEAGDVAPEDALEDLADEANLDDAEAAGKQWKDIAKAVLDVTDDGASAQKILQNLGKVDGFKQVLSGKGVVFEESFQRRSMHSFSLMSLLNEEIGFEDLVKMSGADDLGDDVDKNAVLTQVAQGINDAMEDEIVTDITTGGETEDEELTGEDAELSPEDIEAADEMADKAEQALGSIPFDKLKLARLLKSFPDIAGEGGKATRSRRAFRLAMNKAVGQDIFEEGFSQRDAQLLTERIVNLDTPPQDEFSDPMADHNTDWSTDELVRHRWMRAAGIKGY